MSRIDVVSGRWRGGWPLHRWRVLGRLLLLYLCGVAQGSTGPVCAAGFYLHQPSWAESMLASRAALLSAKLSPGEQDRGAAETWFAMQEDFPVQWDWMLQDGGAAAYGWFAAGETAPMETGLIARALEGIEQPEPALDQQRDRLAAVKGLEGERRRLELYFQLCERRRRQRLRSVLADAPRFVFTKHRTIRPSFFAYTEGQSDAQNERHFLPGSELCLLEMDGLDGRVRTLVSDPKGAIRDPAVSWDGQRVLFAWKKSLNGSDYHLYELDLASQSTRPITFGLGFADYEPVYLPNGDIIFSSTRCVQTVDCWWTEVSNLYTCTSEGRYLRRLGFDQVHTLYPQVLDDGRVIYTRWDYNDRGQIFPQALFQMNPDGTGQTEFYGNNSWFPTTIAHARGIPGTQKVLAILCGHHTSQAGKLAVIDPALGRQENSGVQLVAPVRETPAERIDAYGQQGDLWQYPYALNGNECLVGYAPLGWNRPQRRRGDADFGIYWMDFQGRRELLAWDARLPCSQPVPLVARPKPLLWANRVDYRQTNGTFYLQDVYTGPGLVGVARGTVKKLRVVALQFRAAGIGNNDNAGAAGGALVCTPVAIGNGSWDVKMVLGEAKVYEDGSALFTAPARMPLYFQAIDDNGHAVQTMRSWTTLQPGEYSACVGCHEHKNTPPPAQAPGFSLAMKAGAAPLEPFYGPARGFSFAREIQPILDRHCIRCHKDRTPVLELSRSNTGAAEPSRSSRSAGQSYSEELSFSLLGEVNLDTTAKRQWSDAYLMLTESTLAPGETARSFQGNCDGRFVRWVSAQSVPDLLPPYASGAARSDLLKLLRDGHKSVQLSREELDKIACWIDLLVPYCGDYREANAWTEAELIKYHWFAEKRRQMEAQEYENIRDLLGNPVPERSGGRPMMRR